MNRFDQEKVDHWLAYCGLYTNPWTDNWSYCNEISPATSGPSSPRELTTGGILPKIMGAKQPKENLGAIRKGKEESECQMNNQQASTIMPFPLRPKNGRRK